MSQSSHSNCSQLQVVLLRCLWQRLDSWSPPPVTQRDGVLTSYSLSCSPSPSSLPQSPSQAGPLTVAGFSPDSSYSCSVVATNSQGSGPPAHTTFMTLQDCKSSGSFGVSYSCMCSLNNRCILPVTSQWSHCLL